MTKDQVRDALVLVAEEFEAVGTDTDDLHAVARAYRRAAELVGQIEVRRGPGRPPGPINLRTPSTRVRSRAVAATRGRGRARARA